MAKPDDRSDNVEKLQEMLNNTRENLEEADDYLAAHDETISDQERRAIEENNEQRRQSIEGFREEIKDEARAD